MDTIVVKRNGSRQKFDKKKIEEALGRAGMKKGAGKIASSVAKKVAGEKEIYSGLIRNLVAAELQALDKKLAESYSSFRKAVRKLTEGEVFLENRLAHIVGKHGEVKCVYGGFHIDITDPELFDYRGVLMELLNAKHSVRVELAEGKLRIVTK